MTMGVCISLLGQHEGAALLHRCLSRGRLPAAVGTLRPIPLLLRLRSCCAAVPCVLCRPACR